MHSVSARRDRRLTAVVFASIALACLAAFAFAARAQAAETLYWNNYGAGTIAFANIDGSGGGTPNVGAEEVESPEGLAYDSVTNRLFVPNETTGSGHITAINLDGSGASSFTAPGAPIEEPEGIAVDPVSRTIYWENTENGGSIAWAKLDGSAGGVLNTTGAEVVNPCCRIAIDPEGGRIYWMNLFGPSEAGIAYANLNNTGGGGELDLTGSTLEPGGEGLAVDHAAGRIYFLAGAAVGYANLDGSGGGDLPLAGAPTSTPWGLALDPGIGRIYWGNEGNGEESTNAFGFVGTNGSGAGGISIASAPVAHPQDPLILKAPIPAGAPSVSGSTTTPAGLTCSQGTWASYPGSFVYAEPQSYSYQWTKNGAAIGGATSSGLTATDPGSYACTVTAANQEGSATQTSGGFSVAAPAPTPAPLATPKKARFKLVVKTKKVRVEAGKLATFKILALNQGDLGAKLRVCAKVPKKARKVLKPKCAKLGTVKGKGRKVAKVKVKTKPKAKGTYKLKLIVKGAPGKPAKAKLQIIG